MELSAKIFIVMVLIIFVIMDIIMLVSLLKPGDERNQIIVWKAGTYTLTVTTGVMILNVVQDLIFEASVIINPLIHLEITVILYFAALMYFKKRYSV